MESEYIRPEEIERRSFEIIRSELNCLLPEDISPVVLRCIHTTADFDYAENLYFSEHVISLAMQLLRQGCTVVTDTNMAKAGISKTALTKLGCEIRCFMADEDIARTAKEQGITRASASVEKAAAYGNSLIYVVGNAFGGGDIYPCARHRDAGRFCECSAGKGNAHCIRHSLHCCKGKEGRQQCGCCCHECPALSGMRRKTGVTV